MMKGAKLHSNKNGRETHACRVGSGISPCYKAIRFTCSNVSPHRYDTISRCHEDLHRTRSSWTKKPQNTRVLLGSGVSCHNWAASPAIFNDGNNRGCNHTRVQRPMRQVLNCPSQGAVVTKTTKERRVSELQTIKIKRS